MITPALPYPGIPHAGGKYVWQLANTLDDFGDLVVLATDNPSNRQAHTERGSSTPHVMLSPTTRFQHCVVHLAHRVNDLFYRIDPAGPDLAFVALLILDRHARGLLRGADVIDLQWSAYGRLWPLLRCLNRRARIVGTFHDVDSQRLQRHAQTKTDSLRRARWFLAARISRFFEITASRYLDSTIVFSDKDKLLLAPSGRKASSSRIAVVDPPLGSPSVPARHPNASPTVALVAFFGRAINREAAEWLLSKVWPMVIDAVPETRLRLVGADPDGALTSLAQGHDNITITGFVDDLWSEYAQATLTVVPLLSGAGVKFKTIESLLAGAPVISTTVGAEGIGGEEVLTGVRDDPRDFANAVIDVLRDPVPAERKASLSQAWASEKYGIERFSRTVRRVYGDV